MNKIERIFERFASRTSDLLGQGWVFVVATTATVVGLVFAPINVVNIAISVATLLMVFLLQNTQNKSDQAMHLKLDDLLVRLSDPDDEFAGIEEGPQDEMPDKP